MEVIIRVRPLEWVEDGDGHWKASALTGTYHIVHKPGDLFQLRMSWSLMLYDAQCRSLDEAKAAAQADYEQRILSALASSERSEAVEAAAKAGWNACRKSIYAVCEDVQAQAADPSKVSLAGTPDQKTHEKGFWLGYSCAAKSIARGFSAMEAPDDDNFVAAIRNLAGTKTNGEGA